MATEIKSPLQIDHCISYIDHRLEKTSSQTLQIAEMIIEDIKTLTISYPLALKQNHLREHAEKVRITQMKWVNQLHEIIRDQSNQDLNNHMIQSIQAFMNTLNQNQLKQLPKESSTEQAGSTGSEHPSETRYRALINTEVQAKGTYVTHH